MCTRILCSLSLEKAAPKAFARTTKRGIPITALVVTLAFALLSLLSSVVAADTLFVFLISVSGVGGALTWMTIAWAQYKFRRQYVRAGGRVSDLAYAAPLFPLTPILVILMNIGVFVAMAFDPTQRLSLILGLAVVPVCYALHHFVVKKRQAPPASLDVRPAAPTGSPE